MKYYIIYRNNKFVGYTTNMSTLKHFLKLRGNKYTYSAIKDSHIDKDVRESAEFTECELTYYQGYTLSDELPVFFYEISTIDHMLNMDLKSMYNSANKLIEYVKYFKSNDKKSVKIALKYIQNMIEYLIDTDEPVYDEIIDIISYFNTLMKISKDDIKKTIL